MRNIHNQVGPWHDISVPVLKTFNITGTTALSEILDQYQQVNLILLSDNIDGCVEDNPIIRLDGSLIVDVDYCFNNTNVILESGASIIVQSNVECTLNGDKLYGCDEMWEHIELNEGAILNVTNTEISDAEYAVRLYDKAQVYVSEGRFNNNYIGIYAPPGPGYKERIVNISEGSEFSQTGDLKSPYESVQGNAGIYLNDVQGAAIVGSGAQPITFSGMLNGIVLNYSDAVVSGTRFTDIQLEQGNPTYPAEIQGNGIWSESNGFHTLVVDGDKAGGVEFINVPTAVQIKNMHGIVKGCRMQNCIYGVNVGYGLFNDISVKDNVMDITLRGVRLASPYSIEGSITGNTIVASGYRAVGIELLGTSGSSYFQIVDNKIRLSGAYKGISLIDCERVYILENPIVAWNTVNRDVRAIEILGSRLCGVSCNDLISDGSENKSWGIYVQDSPDIRYNCNTAEDFMHLNQFHGSCSNTEFRGSNILDGYAGLELGANIAGAEAVIGPQIHSGNLWEGNFDWRGAWHYSSNELIILQSLFTCVNNAAELVPPNLSELITLQWFDVVSSGNTFECDETPECNATDLPPPDNILINPGLNFEEFGSVKNWMLDRQLFNQLEDQLVDYSSDQLLQTFYTTNASMLLGRQAIVERKVRNAARVFGQDSVDREDYQLERERLLDSLVEFQSNCYHEDSTIKDAAREEILSTVQSVENQSDTDTAWRFAMMSNFETSINYADQLNQTVSPDSAFEVAQRDIMDIVIRTRYIDTLALSYNDSAVLADIADECAFKLGQTVYSARTWIMMSDTSVTYDDYIVCDQVEPRTSEPNYLTFYKDIGLRFSPNPVSNVITIDWDQGAVEKFIITNVNGKTILEIPTREVKHLEVIIDRIPSGVYVLSGVANNVILSSKKFIVIK